MSFKEDHPQYKSYKKGKYYYSSLPYDFKWSVLESLIDEAGGPDRELLPIVVQKIAVKARAGSVSSGAPYMWIDHLVSKIREQVSNGKFYVLMDCFEILCIDGELNTETLNEFLEESHVGYRAHKRVWNYRIEWEKIEDVGDNKTDNITEDCTVKNINYTKDRKFKEEIVAVKEVKMSGKESRTEIFISHRTVDSDVADMVKDFLVNTGIPNDKIFCSSLPGNDVREQINPEVKDHLKKATIIILILTKDFYESAYCLNEAGVAWYLEDVTAIPIGLPEIEHTSMVGFLDSLYKLYRIDDEGIAYLLERAQERTNSNLAKQTVITREMNKLKKRYKMYISERKLKNQGYNVVQDEDNYDFGDIDEEKISDNPIVQIILNSGRGISFNELVNISELTKETVKMNLQKAIKEGLVQTEGTKQEKLYKIKNL